MVVGIGVGVRPLVGLLATAGVAPVPAAVTILAPRTEADVDAFVAAMFHQHGRGLVRMVRLLVDDRNAAEDLVQEGFIRLARSARRIDDERKAAAYLRSIVLNLARDHNRRGLVSLRHQLPLDGARASVEDEIVLTEEHQAVVDALRDLAPRQRDCLMLRYYDELGIDEIADTLGVSRNSVKTHLGRGMRALEDGLAVLASDLAGEQAEP
jgi:RNA polymerase sigma factor (sigma-70 family)